MELRYADVEYFDRVYLDAELSEEQWCFEDIFGAVYPFTAQHRVHPINAPQPVRRHPPSQSGHCVPLAIVDGEDT